MEPAVAIVLIIAAIGGWAYTSGPEQQNEQAQVVCVPARCAIEIKENKVESTKH